MSRIVTSAAAAAAALAVHAACNTRLLRTPPQRPVGRPAVSVLIPARDEAEHIGACLDAVLASTGCDLEVLVYDDGSADGTADIVRRRAEGDRRVRRLTGPPPPAGWLGKPHACQRLADAAGNDVLVFLDADVRVAPDGIARTAALLDSAGLDLVSPYPRQIAETAGERLVQPLLQWSWLTFLPLRLAERLRAPSLVAANGQLLACTRTAYEAAGGHTAVRGEVIEDVALARAFKRAGRVATVVDGTAIASCRMYRSWAELRDGYSKSLWATTRTTAGAGALAAVLGWLYLLPPAAALWRLVRRQPGAGVAAAGYLAGVAGRVVSARRTGGRVGDAPTHPLAIAALLGLLARSHRARRRGTLAWKGRALP